MVRKQPSDNPTMSAAPPKRERKADRRPAASPLAKEMNDAVGASDAAKNRAFDKVFKKDGLSRALGLPEPPKIRRRRV